MDEIREVKRAHEARWMEMEEVVAVGVGQLEDGEPGIVVSVRSGADEVRTSLPDSVDGVSVEVRTIGDVRAL